jgi:hypothetical protein
MTTRSPDEFRAQAVECQRLAAATVDKQAKKSLLYVAERWLALAEAEDRRLKPKKLPGAPPV